MPRFQFTLARLAMSVGFFALAAACMRSVLTGPSIATMLIALAVPPLLVTGVNVLAMRRPLDAAWPAILYGSVMLGILLALGLMLGMSWAAGAITSG